ncbi:MAG: ferrous iron transporter B, partial [Eubacteriales bacterium]|nr:ferrous iron transporter B [Eubacteriales bacterium]
MIRSAALTGNPNCGKTTIFNALTGSSQYVGNWPGVTVEKKTGKVKRKNINIEVTDLPGIYSINPYSMEEKISEEFIRNENPDVIINVLDATAIERSFFLTLQLIETGKPLIAALNMMDVIEKEGTIIDLEGMINELGISIVPISARINKGISELVDNLSNFKVLEKSPGFDNYLRQINEFKTTGDMSDEKISSFRYAYIKKLISKYVILGEMRSDTTKKIDKVFTNKYAGIPIFLVIMWSIYYISINVVGDVSADFFERMLGSFSAGLGNFLVTIGANEYIISLIIDGVVSGVGAVLLFLPQIMVLFFFISIL